MEIDDDDDVNPNPWIPMPIGGPLADPGWEAREREIDRERGRVREREREREIREIRDRIMGRGEWREAEQMEPQQMMDLGARLQRLLQQSNNYNEYLNLNNYRNRNNNNNH